MSIAVPVETVEHNLENLLGRLHLGETLTLIGSEGNPLAILVSLKPTPSRVETAPDWEARWDALAHRVSQAWRSEKSATEVLAEMRR